MKIEIRGFRKYSIALLTLVFSFIALMCSKMNDVIFFQVVSAVLFLYGAANAANHFSTKNETN
jgi:hypothetical protein